MKLEFLDPAQGSKLLDSQREFGQLFYFLIDGIDVVLRPLTTAETETVASIGDTVPEYILEDWLITNTLVYCSLGTDYILTDAKAGLAKALAGGLMVASNIQSEDEFKKELAEARSKGSLSETIDAFIANAFKNMTRADLRNLTQKTQIRYLVLAESLSGKQLEFGDQKKPGKKRSGNTAWMLSKEAADKPDFERDNAALRGD